METAVGYSPMWLNRPIADNLRMEVFEIANGGQRVTHRAQLRQRETELLQRRHDVDQHNRAVLARYQPWLNRIPAGSERLMFHEMHHAALRATRQRRLFNDLTQYEIANTQTYAGRGPAGSVFIGTGAPPTPPHRVPSRNRQRETGPGAVHDGTAVRLPAVQAAVLQRAVPPCDVAAAAEAAAGQGSVRGVACPPPPRGGGVGWGRRLAPMHRQPLLPLTLSPAQQQQQQQQQQRRPAPPSPPSHARPPKKANRESHASPLLRAAADQR